MGKMTNMMLAALGSAALFTAPANAAELITNGGFETGDLSGWTQGGDTTFDGVTDLAAFVKSGTFGGFFGAIGTTSTLSQSFATVIGESYDVSFWLKHMGSGKPNFFSVSFGGEELLSFTNIAFPAVLDFSGTLVATSTLTDLVFTFREDPSYWALDDVSVDGVPGIVVPEPKSWAMMIGGFGLIGGAVRRRTLKLAAASA